MSHGCMTRLAMARLDRTRFGMARFGIARLTVWLGALLLIACSWLPAPALAGPVDWHELPSTAEGHQWWDAGSLRVNRHGNLTVLSRFQPAPTPRTTSRPARSM